MPAILLCQEFYDELKVPSSPPRRLSRSSIDLRDLEAQHEREKIMSQNVSESVSSIYHCFDSQIRYSESEPINAHIKALENQFSMKSSSNNGELQQPDKNQQHHQNPSESKTSMNNFSFMNNFDHSTTTTAKENDMNLISSASIIKDNHQVNTNNNNNNGNSSSGSSYNGKKSFKKKMLASSDSDFFSLLRYNSVKLRRMNCFSIGSTNDNGSNHGTREVRGDGGGDGSEGGNKPKNMIYALSDSDFLIRVSDHNKTFHLNNEKKIQAIVNKSDILNYLNKSFDHNLLDYNSAQHNQKKLTDVEKQFGDPDLFNVDKLKKVFEESQQKIDSDDNVIIASSNTTNSINNNNNNSNNNSNSNASMMVASEKLQKKETVSLPPLLSNSTSNDNNLKLNNSRSIDTVLLNIKNTNNSDQLCTFKFLHDFSPKAINEGMNKNLLKDTVQSSGSDVDIHSPQSNVASSANNSNNNNNHSPLSIVSAAVANAPVMSSHLLKPVVNLNESLNGQQNVLDLPSINSATTNLKSNESLNPAFLDIGEIGKRKRTASTVTYNVNVIDFHSEDEPNAHHSNGAGKRSNSSTSK